MTSVKEATIDMLDAYFHQKELLRSIVAYYEDANIKYMRMDWEGVAIKAGKFIEAITRLFLIHCNLAAPPSRKFKATNLLKNLESQTNYPDTIRISIPKAGIFVNEVANNRGGRHHSNDVIANRTDAKGILSVLSWILAELVRFSNSETSSPDDASEIIEALSAKAFPLYEQTENRGYINYDKISAQETALLLLYFKQNPNRMSRQDLIDLIVRHGHSKNAANVAATKIRRLVDDDGNTWKLRGLGRIKAEEILERIFKN